MKHEPVGSRKDPRQLNLAQLVVIGTPIVFAAYAFAISVGHGLPILKALPASIANTIPVVLFGVVAYQIIRSSLRSRGLLVQLAGHLFLCAAYALLSYWLLIVLLGAADSLSMLKFNVEPFPIRASVWQLLQNATTYGVIATLAYRDRATPEVTVVLADGRNDAPTGLSRYFIRTGDEIQPIDVESIISIAGADDYAEVTTLAGKHLVRMTLAEFEKSLDPARFIRIHRSRIVNVERIVRAEPAGGGRLLLHMHDGEIISASRTGSRLLRDRVL